MATSRLVNFILWAFLFGQFFSHCRSQASVPTRPGGCCRDGTEVVVLQRCMSTARRTKVAPVTGKEERVEYCTRYAPPRYECRHSYLSADCLQCRCLTVIPQQCTCLRSKAQPPQQQPQPQPHQQYQFGLGRPAASSGN